MRMCRRKNIFVGGASYENFLTRIFCTKVVLHKNFQIYSIWVLRLSRADVLYISNEQSVVTATWQMYTCMTSVALWFLSPSYYLNPCSVGVVYTWAGVRRWNICHARYRYLLAKSLIAIYYRLEGESWLHSTNIAFVIPAYPIHHVVQVYQIHLVCHAQLQRCVFFSVAIMQVLECQSQPYMRPNM